jgi:hypothetical protein
MEAIDLPPCAPACSPDDTPRLAARRPDPCGDDLDAAVADKATIELVDADRLRTLIENSGSEAPRP